MAHPAQQKFCASLKETLPEFFRGRRVLEIGARNINGTVRDLFEDCDYVGVDCEAGKDVDVVCLGHEYEAEPESFDVVCAVETFEHDPHAERTVGHMLRLLRGGGLFFMTCAGEGRGEHGTARTGQPYGPDAGFYLNVDFWQFIGWLREAGGHLSQLHLQYEEQARDLYCYAVKGMRREAT